MKRRSVPSRLLALTAAATVILSQSSVFAAEATSAPPPASSGVEDFIKQSKQPTPWLSWGGDFRARNEYFNGALNLGDVYLPSGKYTIPYEQDYFRFRMRLWSTVTPVTNVTLFTRLAAEPRVWMTPAAGTGHRGRSGGDWRYGILDNVNVKYDNAFNQPLTIKAGRQDIMLGDPLNWWLTGDGTPGDGSWTYFLDSVRMTYAINKETKTTLDMMYIYQNPWNNDWIPCFNNGPRSALTEQTEQGVILYGSTKTVQNMQIDPYFFYKHDRAELANGDDAEIFTLGGKITGDPAEHWKYSVEGAYQVGQKKDPTVGAAYKEVGPNKEEKYRDIGAFGVNASLTYLLKDKLNNQFSFAYEFLSGDDPNTKGDDEMFDVLWGRWPRYSELYLYSYANETSGKTGQHNNMHRIGPQWTITPIKDTTFSAMYNVMLAQEKIPTRATANARNYNLFSNSGTFRGHYLQALVKHKFNSHITGHLWTEFVWMGDYYQQRDMMSFLRAELMFVY